jgi:hypothetical protein
MEGIEMSLKLALLLIALGICVVAGFVVAIAGGVLAWIAGAHPAAAVVRGGAAFAALFLLEITVVTLLWTALS